MRQQQAPLPNHDVIRDRFLQISQNQQIDSAQRIQQAGELLEKNPHIKDFDLSHQDLGNKTASVVAGVIRTNSTLQSLNLSNNNIQASGGKAIGKALAVNTGLRKLDLSRNKLSQTTLLGGFFVDQGLGLVTSVGSAFGKSLRTNTTLEDLNLSETNMNNAAYRKIFQGLQGNTGLKKLDVSQNEIGFPSLRGFIFNHVSSAIARTLRTNTTLEELKLADNKLGNQGGTRIGKALRECSLKSLDLSSNQIYDWTHTGLLKSGITAIAEGISENTSLAHLDISENEPPATPLLLRQQRKKGAALGQMLATNTTLQSLNARDSGLSSGELNQIVNALTGDNVGNPNTPSQGSCSLKSLTINAPDSDDAIQSLITTLVDDHSPQHLSVPDNNIAPDILQHVIDSPNNTLVALEFANSEVIDDNIRQRLNEKLQQNQQRFTNSLPPVAAIEATTRHFYTDTARPKFTTPRDVGKYTFSGNFHNLMNTTQDTTTTFVALQDPALRPYQEILAPRNHWLEKLTLKHNEAVNQHKSGQEITPQQTFHGALTMLAVGLFNRHTEGHNTHMSPGITSLVVSFLSPTDLKNAHLAATELFSERVKAQRVRQAQEPKIDELPDDEPQPGDAPRNRISAAGGHAKAIENPAFASTNGTTSRA